ncbi:MAG: hypothetical protein Q9227_003436 [Pyrenula ochraceoflavens]
MNIAAQDPHTDNVLANAFSAAESKNFKLFLSFDYLAWGAWDQNAVISKINAHQNSSAYFRQGGRPLVSTFEGIQNTADWSNIKAQTGAFFMPDWSSLTPSGVQAHLNDIDGAFSWDAWPNGDSNMTTSEDSSYMGMLGSKPYMMPVSPWFYTNVPNWGKNWLWRGDDLWHDRWEQIAQLQPAMVEIISWNDYGESHYIGPVRDSGIPQGAGNYVSGMSHDAWRTLLPLYIDAYKAGSGNANTATAQTTVALASSSSTNGTSTTSTSQSDTITYWYRKNPANSGSSDGTTGNNPQQGQQVLPPGEVSQDKVFLTVLVSAPSQVSVQIGSNQATTLNAQTVGINHFSVPFNGQTGAVSLGIQRGGQTVAEATGPEITTDCLDGNVNWNAVVGSS